MYVCFIVLLLNVTIFFIQNGKCLSIKFCISYLSINDQFVKQNHIQPDVKK